MVAQSTIKKKGLSNYSFFSTIFPEQLPYPKRLINSRYYVKIRRFVFHYIEFPDPELMEEGNTSIAADLAGMSKVTFWNY
jgi:hypothetical protein